MSKAEINGNIIDGMVTILWGDAWAMHVETAPDEGRKCCRSLAGCRIEDVMPEIPKVAKQLARNLAKDFEKANAGLTIVDLLVGAFRADNDLSENYSDEQVIDKIEEDPYMQGRFGECLAWMAMGAGVSWFDDHEEFPMEIPSVETYNLQCWATDTCPECQRNK